MKRKQIQLNTQDQLMLTLDRLHALLQVATTSRLNELDEAALFHYFGMMDEMTGKIKALLHN